LILNPLLLLAIESANREFLYGLREAGSSSLIGEPMFWSMLLLGCGVAVLAALAVRAIRRDQAMQGPLERHLAGALDLAFADRRLLRQVASEAGFRNACPVIISRGCFDHAAQLHIARRGASARLREIRQRLFDEP
jgi:hypothetical protein